MTEEEKQKLRAMQGLALPIGRQQAKAPVNIERQQNMVILTLPCGTTRFDTIVARKVAIGLINQAEEIEDEIRAAASAPRMKDPN